MDTSLPQLQEILNHLDSKILFLVLQIILLYFIATFIKDFVQTLVDYIEFRSNPYVCIGRKVSIDGFEGIIASIGFRFIVIKNDEQSLLIPVIRWKSYDWKFHRNVVSK